MLLEYAFRIKEEGLNYIVKAVLVDTREYGDIFDDLCSE